jgi:phage terminase small subunit
LLTECVKFAICVVMKALTKKQERFAHLVGAEGLNQTAAYREAYDAKNMSVEAVRVEASRLADAPNVALRVQALQLARQQAAQKAVEFDARKLMETYIAIAFVDPNELISQRIGACRHCWGVDGRYHWKEREYLEALAEWEKMPNDKTGAPVPMPDIAGGFGYRFSVDPNPECAECEGEGVTRIVPMDTTKLSPGARMLYRGVQQTKDGVKVLFANQDKALEQIGRILGAFDDKLRLDMEAKVKSLQLTTTDPREAAEAYAKMVDGTA